MLHNVMYVNEKRGSVGCFLKAWTTRGLMGICDIFKNVRGDCFSNQIWISRSPLSFQRSLSNKPYPFRFKFKSFIRQKPFHLYLYKYENVCVCFCVSVCLFAFFSAIWNPIGISFGKKLPYASEMVLKQ